MSKVHRIALFIHKLDNYGVGRIFLNLTKGMVALGLQVDWVLSDNEGACQIELPDNTRIVTLNTPRLAADVSLINILELVGYLKSEKPEAVISFAHYNNEIAILAKYISFQSVKIVVSDHTVLSKSISMSIRKSRKAIPFVARFIYPFADAIVAVSQEVKRDLSSTLKLNPNCIDVVYNPIIETRLLQKAREKIEHPWFKLLDKPIVLAVGRLAYEKDFETLIYAFSQVHENKHCRLVILGDGPEKIKLIKLVDKLKLSNDILFQGFVDNPYAYMVNSDVLVLPSRWEGLSNVLIEAMALNLPVVSTDCGGPREVLSEGKYGELVPVGDSLSMGKAIQDVLGQKKPRIPTEWLSQFEISTAASHYLDIIEI